MCEQKGPYLRTHPLLEQIVCQVARWEAPTPSLLSSKQTTVLSWAPLPSLAQFAMPPLYSNPAIAAILLLCCHLASASALRQTVWHPSTCCMQLQSRYCLAATLMWDS